MNNGNCAILFDQFLIYFLIIILIDHTQYSLNRSRFNSTFKNAFFDLTEEHYLYHLTPRMENISNYIQLLVIVTKTPQHLSNVSQLQITVYSLLINRNKLHYRNIYLNGWYRVLSIVVLMPKGMPIKLLGSCFYLIFIKQNYLIEKMPRKNLRIHRRKNHGIYHHQTEHTTSFSMTQQQPFIDKTKQYLADLEKQQKTSIIKPSTSFSFDMSIQQWRSTVDPTALESIQNVNSRESINLLPPKEQPYLISKSFCNKTRSRDGDSCSHQKQNKKEFQITKNRLTRYRNIQQVQTPIKLEKKSIQPILFAMQSPSKPIRLNFGSPTNLKQINNRVLTQKSHPSEQKNQNDDIFLSTNRFILRNRAITAKGFQLFRSKNQRHLINFSISQRKFQ